MGKKCVAFLLTLLWHYGMALQCTAQPYPTLPRPFPSQPVAYGLDVCSSGNVRILSDFIQFNRVFYPVFTPCFNRVNRVSIAVCGVFWRVLAGREIAGFSHVSLFASFAVLAADMRYKGNCWEISDSYGGDCMVSWIVLAKA